MTFSAESGVAGPEAEDRRTHQNPENTVLCSSNSDPENTVLCSPGRLMVWSPRKRRLAILRLYQALGNARISLSRLMSYLKEAEPMSHTAKRRRRNVDEKKKRPLVVNNHQQIFKCFV